MRRNVRGTEFWHSESVQEVLAVITNEGWGGGGEEGRRRKGKGRKLKR